MSCFGVLGLVLILLPLLKVIFIKSLLMWIANKHFWSWVFKCGTCPHTDDFDIQSRQIVPYQCVKELYYI